MHYSAWHVVNAQEILSILIIVVAAIVFCSLFGRTHSKRERQTVPCSDETLKCESLSQEEWLKSLRPVSLIYRSFEIALFKYTNGFQKKKEIQLHSGTREDGNRMN